MLTHLLRLIWNKKKQNFLLLFELFISFIGLFAGFTFVLYPYNNYRLPLGFQSENIWVVSFNDPENIKNIDSLQVFRESLKKVVLPMQGVKDVTFTSANIPFSGNGFNMGITYNGNETWADVYTAEDQYMNVMGLKLLEGRWFTSDDNSAKEKPTVLNETLKKLVFGEENALGKVIELEGSQRLKVVGVVASSKHESEMEVPPSGLYRRMDTSNMRDNIIALVKVAPGADAALESRMHKLLSNSVENGNIEIEYLTDMRDNRNKAMRIPLYIFLTIAGFLIINVALGVFGVLWYNLNKRRGEIGLRRAVGASGKAISRQLITEAVLLATLSLLLGLFFAIQFPLLKVFALPVSNYITAIICSILFIYLLVIVCALYPGKQAAAIYPAVALHED